MLIFQHSDTMAAKRKLMFGTPRSTKKTRTRSFTQSESRAITSRRGISRGFALYARPRSVGFADPVLAKLRYSTIIQLNPTLTAPAVFVFKANSLNDPEDPAGGHQPKGFDEYKAIYAHYQVLAAKIRVDMPSSLNEQVIVGISIKRTATHNSVITNYIEDGDCVWSNGHIMNDRPLTKNVNVANWLGMSASNDRLEAGVTSNPEEQLYYHVWVSGLGAVDEASRQLLVTIDYTSKFRERKALAQS